VQGGALEHKEAAGRAEGAVPGEVENVGLELAESALEDGRNDVEKRTKVDFLVASSAQGAGDGLELGFEPLESGKARGTRIGGGKEYA
jgi:hypothetical protein